VLGYRRAMTDPVVTALAERSDPPFVGSERLQLEAWLEFHRATLLVKCEGLTSDQLKIKSVPPSALSLLGLVRHMAEVEVNWFRRVLSGEAADYYFCTDDYPDGDFDLTETADAAADVTTFLATVDASRAIAAEWPDLEAVGNRRRHGHEVSLRWIYVHMIEEYARHNGHADLLRECIDGAVGD
jgi:hypothetical protein